SCWRGWPDNGGRAMATALLVIDMQRSLLDDGPWRAAGLVAAVRALVRRAHAAGAPVVFIRDTRVGPDGSIEASLPRRDGDLEFTKDFCDAFHGTGLHEALQE